jgi:hypothetical protein
VLPISENNAACDASCILPPVNGRQCLVGAGPVGKGRGEGSSRRESKDFARLQATCIALRRIALLALA